LLDFYGTAYRVLDMVGQGSFGQVVKCLVQHRTGSSALGAARSDFVAVKVVKNKPAYYNQAMVETRILRLLNSDEAGPDKDKDKVGVVDKDKSVELVVAARRRRPIVRLLDSFEFKNHLCLVFELLSINLYELIKQNKFRGLPMPFIRSCLAQVADALSQLQELGIVHCDLKPENVLLEDLGSAKVQLIDFGSSCFAGQTVYAYIQSRFYRAPEVLVGAPYGAPIDLWSLGCLAVELFIGLPVFPGVSEHNQLARITETMGPLPDRMLDGARETRKFYNAVTRKGSVSAPGSAPGSASSASESSSTSTSTASSVSSRSSGAAQARLDDHSGGGGGGGSSSSGVSGALGAARWELKSAEEWAASRGLDKAEVTKRYVKDILLEDIVLKGCNRPSGELSKPEPANAQDKETDEASRNARAALLDLARGLLQADPAARWTAQDVKRHPFVTGQSFGALFICSAEAAAAAAATSSAAPARAAAAAATGPAAAAAPAPAPAKPTSAKLAGEPGTVVDIELGRTAPAAAAVVAQAATLHPTPGRAPASRSPRLQARPAGDSIDKKGSKSKSEAGLFTAVPPSEFYPAAAAAATARTAATATAASAASASGGLAVPSAAFLAGSAGQLALQHHLMLQQLQAASQQQAAASQHAAVQLLIHHQQQQQLQQQQQQQQQLLAGSSGGDTPLSGSWGGAFNWDALRISVGQGGTGPASLSSSKGSPLSPPSRPHPPYPLAHQAPWDSGHPLIDLSYSGAANGGWLFAPGSSAGSWAQQPLSASLQPHAGIHGVGSCPPNYYSPGLAGMLPLGAPVFFPAASNALAYVGSGSAGGAFASPHQSFGLSPAAAAAAIGATSIELASPALAAAVQEAQAQAQAQAHLQPDGGVGMTRRHSYGDSEGPFALYYHQQQQQQRQFMWQQQQQQQQQQQSPPQLMRQHQDQPHFQSPQESRGPGFQPRAQQVQLPPGARAAFTYAPHGLVPGQLVTPQQVFAQQLQVQVQEQEQQHDPRRRQQHQPPLLQQPQLGRHQRLPSSPLQPEPGLASAIDESPLEDDEATLFKLSPELSEV
jgi:serine/threonine protein kinase